MSETRAEHPLEALEQRTASLLDGLREGRLRERQLSSDQRQLLDDKQRLASELNAARERLGDLEAQLDALRQAQQTLETEHRALASQRESLLEERTSLIEERASLIEERTSLIQERTALFEENSELKEENRELDEQNRELEAHNARLRDRVEHPDHEPDITAFRPPQRRAQGLAALMQHRPRPVSDSPVIDSPARDEREQGASSSAPTIASQPGQESPASLGHGSEPVKDERAQESTAAEVTATENPPTATADTAALSSHSDDQVAEKPDTEVGVQGDLAFDKAPSPQALLGDWYRRYDQTFFKGHTRPLKVGIHEELAAREPWPEKLVRRALACYVNLPRYLKSVREGAERIGLDGELVGQVDAQAAEHAKRKLDRLQAEQRGRGTMSRRRRNKGHGNDKPSGSDNHSDSDKRSDSGKPSGTGNSDTSASAKALTHAGHRDTGSVSAKPARPTESVTSAVTSDPQGDGEETRLQRKLDELLARHNSSR
ncbi:ProQ/FINO family protein [Halomonas sp. DP8Y7-3]|uniref:ProQ/FINO family protein n=1 Tax=Halomonas sp. DP8Y7-3 TaxID=2859079 RepID=UPI0028F6DBE4|nr:ProQ/FINO family protein [Halomonas sp. DP8Y7-3]